MKQTTITPVPKYVDSIERYADEMAVWIEDLQRNVDTDLGIALTVTDGTGDIVNGSTDVSIAHELGTTPTSINITFWNKATVDHGRWWVSDISDSKFHLNVETDPGASGLGFGWEARAT